MADTFAREVDLACVVVAWLRDQHWDVYQEVQTHRAGMRADIVAVQGRIVWVIETKLTLGFSVIGQAAEWTHYAHYVSAAVPKAKRRSSNSVAIHAALTTLGIGLLLVSPERDRWTAGVEETMPTPLHRKALVSVLRDALTEGHKTFAAAGNADGRFYSPFQETCLRLRRYLKEHGSVPIGQAIESIDHHYRRTSTAKGCLVKWIDLGKVRGVRINRDGSKHLVELTGEE